jgi:Mrp family chromosome partitioning ATPase
MTLEQYWVILRKQWRLVIFCFLVVGVASFIGSKLMRPVYQSSALVQIEVTSNSNTPADYTALLASDQLVQTEAALATSDSVLSAVAAHYPGLTTAQLAGEVSTNPKTNTQLFEIDVVDPDPTRAAQLANDIAATLIKQQSQAIAQNNIQSQQQLQQEINQTQQQINAINAKLAAAQAPGGDQSQINGLKQQLSSLQQHYDQWEAALAQLELAQAQNGDFLRVAQQAQPASKPARPNVMLDTAGGFVVGLLLGLLLALLYGRFDTRVRNADEVTQLLEWPVLASIWRADPAKQEQVINPTKHDPNVEAYRILRTNIGFSSLDKPLRTLLVSSCIPGEGKSSVAANLAIFMANAGKSTLLIDADLRLPAQRTIFGLAPEAPGLSNAILAMNAPAMPKAPTSRQFFTPLPVAQMPNGANAGEQLPLEPFIHTVGIPNLWVMPSGPLPPNPSELLESKSMQRLLKLLENSSIEVVIFDSPPLLGLSDASILAAKVDGVLLVIDILRARRPLFKQVKQVLSQANAHVLGCIVNKQRHSRENSAYGYYYYYGHSDEAKSSNKPASNGQLVSPPPISMPTGVPLRGKQ